MSMARKTLEICLKDFEPILKAIARRYATWYIGADDLAQEARLRIALRWDTYRHEMPFAAWASKVAASVMIDTLRREGRMARQSAFSLDHPAPGSDHPYGELLIAPCLLTPILTRAQLQDDLARVGEHARAVVLLRGEGLGYEEIAERLNIPTGTVRSRLWRQWQAERDRAKSA